MIGKSINKKIIVGLGNPDDKYYFNRHNVGYLFVISLASYFNNNFKIINNHKLLSWIIEINNLKNISEINIPDSFKLFLKMVDKLYFILPQTYMNNSGIAVKKVLDYYKFLPDDLVVCHDDLDIEFPKCKFQYSKGPKIHNGIKSIENHLKTINFFRFRIGIKTNTVIKGKEYVLSNFTKNELDIIFKTFNLKIFNYVKLP